MPSVYDFFGGRAKRLPCWIRVNAIISIEENSVQHMPAHNRFRIDVGVH